MFNIQVKRGKEKAILQRHPWLFSGALETPKKEIGSGDIVRLHDAQKHFLAYGYYNPSSKISVRLLEWDEDVILDRNWWEKKIKESIERRKFLEDDAGTTAYRLIHGEADFLPGLIVDRYADYLSVQFLTAGIDKWKTDIVEILKKQLKPSAIIERSDATARKLEGLETENAVLWGKLEENIEVMENEKKFHVNLQDGQKSGYYVDQRDNRSILAGFAKGKSVLDCFSYTGAFSIYAKAEGASSVRSVDSSELAIQTLKVNYAANGLAFQEEEIIEADCFEYLRICQDIFDIVILDPPKLAPTRSSVERAQRAYKDINRLGMTRVVPGGLLATFSCSAGMDMALFKQVIAWAALDAGREVQIVQQLCQPADHPIRVSFPESEYLKGLLCRIL